MRNMKTGRWKNQIKNNFLDIGISNRAKERTGVVVVLELHKLSTQPTRMRRYYNIGCQQMRHVRAHIPKVQARNDYEQMDQSFNKAVRREA